MAKLPSRYAGEGRLAAIDLYAIALLQQHELAALGDIHDGILLRIKADFLAGDRRRAAEGELAGSATHFHARQVTKLQAAMTQLLNKAASGDFGAMRILLQVMPGMEAQVARIGAPALSDERDRQVLDELLKRFKQPKQSK